MKKNLIVSYLTLRSTIGILGMSLFLLSIAGVIFSGTEFRPSISQYYWTNSRDVFVGILFVAGAFLLTYKGYDLFDRLLTTIAGVAAIGVAIFPSTFGQHNVGYFQFPAPLTTTLHFVFAFILFAAVGAMAYFQFSKGSDEKNNRIYKKSGLIIFSSLVLLAIGLLISQEFMHRFYIVFWLETIMLFAFGVSWLTKGRFLRSEVHDESTKEEAE